VSSGQGSQDAPATVVLHFTPSRPASPATGYNYRNKEFLRIVFEPMPWELIPTRQPLATNAMPFTQHLLQSTIVHNCPAVHNHPADTFFMLSLGTALPNPMCLEATIAPLAAPLSPAAKPTPVDCLATKRSHVTTWADAPSFVPMDRGPLLGPDGELWQPADPVHSYDGPQAFDPEAEWSMNLSNFVPPAVPDASPPLSLSPDVEATLLPLGLLDSPPKQAAAAAAEHTDGLGNIIDTFYEAFLSEPP
jgi:hypothetical protein